MVPPNEVSVRFLSRSEQDTDQFGRWLANSLRGGDIVALNGELGAGKTRLVRAIVLALTRGPVSVSSPTFVLMQHYGSDPPVVHLDAYRLADADEFRDLGIEEIFDPETICLIEWASRIENALPPEHTQIDIVTTGAMSREFVMRGSGPRSRELFMELKAQIDSASR